MKPKIRISSYGYISAGVDNEHQEKLVRMFVRDMTLVKIKRKNPVFGRIIERGIAGEL